MGIKTRLQWRGFGSWKPNECGIKRRGNVKQFTYANLIAVLDDVYGVFAIKIIIYGLRNAFYGTTIGD